jgi:predicted RecB family nuclease
MEALVLLCERCGADAALAQRLHAAGCADLEDVVRLPPEELARILGASNETAQALLREARALIAQTAPPDDLSATALRPHLFAGFDPAACVRMREFGVDTLDDLIKAEPLELSRAMEFGVTRVMRLQLLARRWAEEHKLGQRPPEDVHAPLPARFSPAERDERGAPSFASELEQFASSRSGGAAPSRRR